MKIFNRIIITEQNNSLRALTISDLHVYKENDIRALEKIVEHLNNKSYDVIFLVGDIIDATNLLHDDSYVTGKLLTFISYLGEVAPTYIVHGTHDIAYRSVNEWQCDYQSSYDLFLNKLAAMKSVYVLENEIKKIKEGYMVAGYSPSFNYTKSAPDGNDYILSNEYKDFDFLNSLDSKTTNTFLCHYPNIIYYLYRNNRLSNVDVSIAGHNHNGVTQFKFFPMEGLLNLLGQKNRGIITPGKSLKLKDTRCLRGNVQLDERSTLIINPSFKTLSASTGVLETFDSLFYKGATEINYVPKIKILK